MRLEPVIGLEIHCQLKTNSKMFCSCARVSEASAPNTSICPICMGHPGVLPVPNQQAIQLGIKAGLAMQGTINTQTKFDRKNYFYPDLPKSYQITQYDKPISEGGELIVDVPDNSLKDRKTIRVRFERLHLEEDAAKLTHGTTGESFVDYNRGGTPLAEIVTRPDMRSPEEARAFLQELRRILRDLDISDADLEKGNMRCDANVSLRPVDANGMPTETILRPKTEIKNINSFRAIERAIYYEIDRQTELWNMNTPPSVSSTRGWNDTKGITELQRTKEGAADYRYFPEPDIPPMSIADLVEKQKKSTQELPAAKRSRFMAEYFVSESDARILTDDKALANFFEKTVSECIDWMRSIGKDAQGNDLTETQVWPLHGRELSKLITGWMLSKLAGLMKVKGIEWSNLTISAENFAELIKIIYNQETTGPNALKILELMLDAKADNASQDPSNIMESLGLGRIADTGIIQELAAQTIAAYPKQVAEFKAGKEPILKFLVGMVMKASQGKADPELAESALREQLK